MGIATTAWLAATAGGITGAIVAYIRGRRPPRRAVIAVVLPSALIAVLAYGAFLAAGFVVSLLTFSGAPDPGPALLCVALGCGAFVLLAWLQSALGPRFGLQSTRPASRRRGLNELLDAVPSGGPATMWLGGVCLALLPVLYGMRCLVTRKGSLGTLLWPSAVEGGAATALGLGWIGVGAFLHFHFFFGLHPELGLHSRSGKRLALIAACAAFSIAGVWSMLATTR